MSSNYWQTERQRERYSTGRTVARRVEDYTRIWENRCYPDGIPDETSKRLNDSGRVPNYKAIAMCILKNDFNLHGVGFTRRESDLSLKLIRNKNI